MFPLHERLVDRLDIETRIVGRLDQFLGVVALEPDGLLRVLQRRLAVGPFLAVGLHFRFRRQLDAAEDDVAHVPGLRIEHVERVELVLHAEIEQLRVLLPDDAFIEALHPHPVGGLQPQVFGEEREIVQITGAHDDGVEIARGAVLEVAGLAFHPHQKRLFFPVFRPFEAHRLRTVAVGDEARAVFIALRADILGRVAAADQKNVLALEFQRVTEVVRVHDAAGEFLDAVEMRHVGRREVARRDHYIVEFLGIDLVRIPVVHGDGELAAGIGIGDHAHGTVEAHPFAHVGLFDAALDVVPQNGAGRVGRDRVAEMLLERIVGEFQAFLRAVRPEIAVHAAVDGVAVFVGAGAPGVVPQAAPVRLLFEADDFGDLGALACCGLKGPELG